MFHVFVIDVAVINAIPDECKKKDFWRSFYDCESQDAFDFRKILILSNDIQDFLMFDIDDEDYIFVILYSIDNNKFFIVMKCFDLQYLHSYFELIFNY